jgi:hypothetical protein
MRLIRARRRYSGISRQQIFSDIYRKGVWGASQETLYSGPGSLPDNILPYAEFVGRFIAEHNVRSVVDFGCGDFQVGRRFDLGNATYLGCDIVPLVIEENSRNFSASNRSFAVFDLLGDDAYPDAELCLIRQVLQHFSNADVAKVLARLNKYRYVLITDGQTVGDNSTRNFDIETFHLTRSIYESGLRLELPPFSLPIRTVLEYDHVCDAAQPQRSPTKLRTILLQRAEPMAGPRGQAADPS